MSKHSQEESRHQEQILKLQADMATRIAKYEERILSLEEQLKVLSTSQKEGNATFARMEQLLSYLKKISPSRQEQYNHREVES